MRIFSKLSKIILPAAVLVLAAFVFYFRYAFGEFGETLVREKAWEKQQEVGLIGVIVDTLAESGGEIGYEQVLTAAVRYIETEYTMTFAQIYDEELTPLLELSPGVGGGQKHNPLDYPEFVRAVEFYEAGTLTYKYKTAQAGEREIHMCFRWVPSDATHETRRLVAVGISKYTINENINPAVEYGAVALITVATVFILGCAVLLVRLGHIYDQRTGDSKWRGDGGA